MIGDILQPTHLLFVLVVALLVLGPKRLPEVGRSLGRGLRNFRNALSGEDRDYDALAQTATQTGPDASTRAPATETSQPAEPLHPTEASAPAEPTQPTEASQAGEPTQPTQPVS